MAPTNTHNGVPHDNEKGSVHMEEHTSHQPLPQNPIQLTPAQYERLFFQPGGAGTARLQRPLTGIIGDFYFIGGLGMTIGGVFEWALGNTFPFVLRLSLGVLFDPSKGIASAFPDGTDSPAFNHGYVFLTLVLTFAFLAAAYRQSGLGNANMSLTFLKTAGAFGFANIVGGWYLAVVLVFAAVDMPFDLPVGDLSRFLNKRKTD
ncbi:hypothetical protein B0H14DRAFT_2837756 [Mycena olivaceomarginata]|nr:hypothetical protein B0H14DRAFT_2837756 [Mycena olivaceomarginata]